MKIQVTQEDIDIARYEGMQPACYHCPIARALKRQFPGKQVHVGASSVWVEGFASRGLPDNAYYFIVKYDYRRPVAPFEFEVPFGDNQ